MHRAARLPALVATLFTGAIAAVFSMAAVAAATALANPASKNCAEKGGKPTVEKNSRGAEFGVCTFADDLQCEEWAMLRGDCRTGGIRVAGYVTSAARYCAITGGLYAVASASNTPDEQGNCKFKGGKMCEAAAYFSGACTKGTAKPMRAAATTTQIQARFLCSAGKFIDATFVNGAASSVVLKLSDGRTLTLPQTISGSGARYATADASIVFWNKGNTSFVEEGGKTTFDGCATRR